MSVTFFFTFIFLSFALLPLSTAHNALFDISMFGRCGTDNQCENQGEPGVPLQDLKFNDWWWHKNLDYPPPADAIMALPAGKTAKVEIACNSAFTTLGGQPQAYWPGGALKGEKNESVENDPGYWLDGAGNLHASGLSDVAGCGLSIAYTDDPRAVRPEDFVIFSIQHECVWHRDEFFDVPAAMPPCPNGKCMCSWWWIHNSDGGTDQMYQTPFQCNIVYDPGQNISTTPLGKPVPPVNCENDPSKCIKGPKMPMYWKQLECNNMPEPGHFAPTYSTKYGFEQGAQTDIFQTINHSNWTCPQSTARGVSHKRSTPVPLRHKQAKRRTFLG